jgi:hypothetical protein
MLFITAFNIRLIPSDDARPLRLDGPSLVKQSQSNVAVWRGCVRSLVAKQKLNQKRQRNVGGL